MEDDEDDQPTIPVKISVGHTETIEMRVPLNDIIVYQWCDFVRDVKRGVTGTILVRDPRYKVEISYERPILHIWVKDIQGIELYTQRVCSVYQVLMIPRSVLIHYRKKRYIFDRNVDMLADAFGKMTCGGGENDAELDAVIQQCAEVSLADNHN